MEKMLNTLILIIPVWAISARTSQEKKSIHFNAQRFYVFEQNCGRGRLPTRIIAATTALLVPDDRSVHWAPQEGDKVSRFGGKHETNSRLQRDSMP
jgi:hypothetical protein